MIIYIRFNSFLITVNSFLKPKFLTGFLTTCVLLGACASPSVVPTGFYKVKRGDTLSHIASYNKQNVGDLARWNRLSNPNQIEIGQVLRIAPPNGRAIHDIAATNQAKTKRRSNQSIASTNPNRSNHARASQSNIAPANPSTKFSASSLGNEHTNHPAGHSASIKIIWPTSGTVQRRYGAGGNKGIDLSGQIGDRVMAAAAGSIVYTGQLRGYGNLIIVKHDSAFLTAYSHLSQILVQEKQSVTSGQVIGKVGQSEAPSPLLHFELRLHGKPIDPEPYLPKK